MRAPLLTELLGELSVLAADLGVHFRVDRLRLDVRLALIQLRHLIVLRVVELHGALVSKVAVIEDVRLCVHQI